ncbi:hypothetical protein Pse7367_3778 (plasmid) [Thalassoporum mexicanum PCC 7367]|uniref:hypothetical protein n=1 Tax=Thalassoporum mexicanum TaxID=3457544 RepID=UPI00029FE6F4|nr:hypothetical protein [Pseudanabaena sp. PCC 7367]AFY72002.1 hypothetical protein Pse7367_3778 [Pseudanabaena sp. PCC 7367]
MSEDNKKPPNIGHNKGPSIEPEEPKTSKSSKFIRYAKHAKNLVKSGVRKHPLVNRVVTAYEIYQELDGQKDKAEQKIEEREPYHIREQSRRLEARRDADKKQAFLGKKPASDYTLRKQVEKATPFEEVYSRESHKPQAQNLWGKAIYEASSVGKQVEQRNYVTHNAGEKYQSLLYQKINDQGISKLDRVYEPHAAITADRQIARDMYVAGLERGQISQAILQKSPQAQGLSKRIEARYIQETTKSLERNPYLKESRDEVAQWRNEHHIDPSDKRLPYEYDKAIVNKLERAREIYDQAKQNPHENYPLAQEHKYEYQRQLGERTRTETPEKIISDYFPRDPKIPSIIDQKISANMYVTGFDREEINEALDSHSPRIHGRTESYKQNYFDQHITPTLEQNEQKRAEVSNLKEEMGISHVRRSDQLEQHYDKPLSSSMPSSSRSDEPSIGDRSIDD